MKKRFSIIACVALVFSLALAVGAVSVIGPCVHEDGSFGACHWAGQALLGVGALLAAQSLLALIFSDFGARKGIFLSMIPTALLGALIPGTLIDLCRMASMRCRAVMQPAAILLSALILLLALIGAILEKKKEK